MTRFFQVCCVIGCLFGFAWIWYVLRGVLGSFDVLNVLVGLGLYMSTLDSFLSFLSFRRPWARFVLWLFAALWSVYTLILIAASHPTPPDLANVPHWMQVTSPYVYALAPFLIIWGIRTVVPVYWRKWQ